MQTAPEQHRGVYKHTYQSSVRVSDVHRWIRLAEAISDSAASATPLRSALLLTFVISVNPMGRILAMMGEWEAKRSLGREDAEHRGNRGSSGEPQSSVASPLAAVGV